MAGFESGYKAGVASTPKTSLGLEIASVGENYQKIKAQEKKLKDNFNKGREDFRAKWKESTGEDINEIDFNYTGIADVDGVYSAMSNASRKVLESANWAHNQNLVQDSELPKIGSMVTKGTAEFAGFMGQLKDNLDIDTELSKENKSSRVNKFISNNIGSAMKGIGFTFDENGFNAVFENGASVYTSNILENTEMREKLDLFDLSKEIIGTPGAEEVVDDKSLVKYYDRNKDYSKSIGIAVDGLDPRSMIDLAMQLDILEDKKTSIDGAGLKLGLDDLNSEDVREKLKPVVEKKLNEHLMETLGNRKEIEPIDKQGKEEEVEFYSEPNIAKDNYAYSGQVFENKKYDMATLLMDMNSAAGDTYKTAEGTPVRLMDMAVQDGKPLVDSFLDKMSDESKTEFTKQNRDLYTVVKKADGSERPEPRKDIEITALDLNFSKASRDFMPESSSKHKQLVPIGLVFTLQKGEDFVDGEIKQMPVGINSVRLRTLVNTFSDKELATLAGTGQISKEEIKTISQKEGVSIDVTPALESTLIKYYWEDSLKGNKAMKEEFARQYKQIKEDLGGKPLSFEKYQEAIFNTLMKYQ